MAANNLQLDSFWVDKSKYDDAERQYYEKLANASLTPLADEVAKARQRLIEIRGTIDASTSTCELLKSSEPIEHQQGHVEVKDVAVEQVPALKDILTETSAQIQPVEACQLTNKQTVKDIRKNISLKDIISDNKNVSLIASPNTAVEAPKSAIDLANKSDKMAKVGSPNPAPIDIAAAISSSAVVAAAFGSTVSAEKKLAEADVKQADVALKSDNQSAKSAKNKKQQAPPTPQTTEVGAFKKSKGNKHGKHQSVDLVQSLPVDATLSKPKIDEKMPEIIQITNPISLNTPSIDTKKAIEIIKPTAVAPVVSDADIKQAKDIAEAIKSELNVAKNLAQIVKESTLIGANKAESAFKKTEPIITDIDTDSVIPVDVIKIEPIKVDSVKPIDAIKIEPIKVASINPADITIKPIKVDSVKLADAVRIESIKVDSVKPADAIKIEPIIIDSVMAADAIKIEPIKVDSVKPADAIKIEPIKVDSVKPADSIKMEPIIVDSVKPADAIKIEPVIVDSVKSADAIKIEPIVVDSVKPADVIKNKQIKVDSVKPDSTKIKPIKVDAVKPADVKVDTAKPVCSKTEHKKSSKGNKSEIVKTDCGKSDKTENKKVESVKTDNKKSESAKTENKKVESVKTENKKVESVKPADIKFEVHKKGDSCKSVDIFKPETGIVKAAEAEVKTVDALVNPTEVIKSEVKPAETMKTPPIEAAKTGVISVAAAADINVTVDAISNPVQPTTRDLKLDALDAFKGAETADAIIKCTEPLLDIAKVELKSEPANTIDLIKPVELTNIDKHASKLVEAVVDPVVLVKSSSAVVESTKNALPQATQPVTDHKAVQLTADRKSASTVAPDSKMVGSTIDAESIAFIKDMFVTINKTVSHLQSELSKFEQRLAAVEKNSGVITKAVAPKQTNTKVEDDDVDLFGSDSEDDAEAERVKTERVAAYAAKKSNKPVLIAKSSILLDVKVWDDEIDMKALEVEVRKISMDGLLWGASKLVPLAYGIHKLQINCIVEDDKVSIDELQEKIEANEEFVQSVDIAAFNKI